MEGRGILSLLMLFVGCICPMQEIQNENENVAQIRGVMYMKIIAIIEDDQHIGDILERTLTREGLWDAPGIFRNGGALPAL